MLHRVALRRRKDSPLVGNTMTTAYSTTVSRIAPLEVNHALRRYAMLGLYAVSGFSGLSQGLIGEHAFLESLSALEFAAVATLWLTVDVRLRGRAIVPALQMVVFFTWPVATLIHLMTTRNLKGFGLWLLHVAGLITTFSLALMLGFALRYWLGGAAPSAMP